MLKSMKILNANSNAKTFIDDINLNLKEVGESIEVYVSDSATTLVSKLNNVFSTISNTEMLYNSMSANSFVEAINRNFAKLKEHAIDIIDDADTPGMIQMQAGLLGTESNNSINFTGYYNVLDFTVNSYTKYRHSIKLIDNTAHIIVGVASNNTLIDTTIEDVYILGFDAEGKYANEYITDFAGIKNMNSPYIKFMFKKKSGNYTYEELNASLKLIYDIENAEHPKQRPNTLPRLETQVTRDGVTKTVPYEGHFIYKTSLDEVFPNQFVNTSGYDGYNHHVDKGFIKLPTMYSINGSPTPLAVFVHGTSGWSWTGHTGYNSASASGYDYFYEEVQAFLVRNGYAVCDCSGITSKNKDIIINGTTNAFCTPSFAASIVSMVEYLMKNYNLRKTGIYIYGKSSGGMMVHMGTLIQKLHDKFTISAIGSLAPAMSPIGSMRYYGRNYDKAMSIAAAELNIPHTFGNGRWDMGDTSPVEGNQYNDEQAMVEFIDKWRKIDGFFGEYQTDKYNDTTLTNTDVANAAQACYSANTTNVVHSNIVSQALLTYNRKINIPTKIWNFSRDSAVHNAMGESIYTSATRLNHDNLCERKLVPEIDGHFGHHSDDINAATATYILPDGNETTATMVYIDLVEFFRKHNGVENLNNGENYNVWDILN